jgi:hypothetical protein
VTRRKFITLGALRPGALLVGSSANFANRRDQIIALAARRAIPTIYESREFAKACRPGMGGRFDEARPISGQALTHTLDQHAANLGR